MRNKWLVFAVVDMLIFMLLAGGFLYYRLRAPLSENGKLRIVTTFLPLYIFTVNVAGDAAIVENLLPQGIGPHDYAFAPSDAVKIARADVVVTQGRGIDDWTGRIIDAAGRADVEVVVASEGIVPHTGAPRYNIDEGAVSAVNADDLMRPDENDPHLWLDPFLAVKEVERIRDGLMRMDPAHADLYARNAEGYTLRLLELDTNIRSMLHNVPKRDFIAFHDAFRYFGYEYGLRQVAAIETIPGEEPSPAELAEIIKQIRAYDVRVIFSEPQFSPKIVEMLARDYGLFVVQIDTLETGEPHPDYYEEVMMNNVQRIVSAFRK